MSADLKGHPAMFENSAFCKDRAGWHDVEATAIMQRLTVEGLIRKIKGDRVLWQNSLMASNNKDVT